MRNLMTPDLLAAFRRFPVPILCTFALYISYLALRFEEAVIFVPCCFFFFGVGRLLAEVHGWKAWKEGLFGIVGGIGGTFLLSASAATGSPQAFILAVLLMVGVAPFIGRRSDDFSFWYYNRQLWGGTALACLAALLVIGGISAIVASVEYLFSVPMPFYSFRHVIAFGCIVYAPIAALAAVPQNFDVRQEECSSEKSILFLLNWILAPLAIVYFVILYAYGLKMLMLWEIPKGQISFMVAGFGALGIVTYLIGWPLREISKRHVAFLYKHFFTLLLPPAVLMAVAIGIRIHHYGLTEDRYLVALLAAWFLGLGALYTLRPRASLKFIMISLMVLMFGASFGPWGIVSMSQRSQVGILKDVLARNNMLDNGRAVPRTGEITVEDEKKISSIVVYLSGQERLGRAATDLLPPQGLTGRRNKQRVSLAQTMQALDLEYVPAHRQGRIAGDGSTMMEFHARTSYNTFDTAGYDHLYAGLYLHSTKDGSDMRRPVDHSGREAGTLILRADDILFEPVGATPVSFNVTSLLPDVTESKPSSERPPIALEAAQGQYKFVINSMILNVYPDGKRTIREARGYLLVRDSAELPE